MSAAETEESARGPARNAMPVGKHTRANALQHRWSDEKEKGEWYAGGFSYWSGEAATNDGMLGGFADVDIADTADSLKFMKRCGALPESQRNGGSRVIRALDVGAGIGRVTGGALLQLADTVDLLESDAKFVERAKGALAWAAPRVERFHCQPMQEFVAELCGYVERKPGHGQPARPKRQIGRGWLKCGAACSTSWHRGTGAESYEVVKRPLEGQLAEV